MLPHKTDRGQAAMGRLKVFEGIPPPYDKQKRMVVPDALRITRLRPGRKFTVIGELATQVGWKHGELVKKLEAKRKTRSAAFYKTKLALNAAKSKAASKVRTAFWGMLPLLSIVTSFAL